MTASPKKKAARKAPEPSYRAIQLAILAELRTQTALLTTLCQHQGGSPAPTSGLLSKSILEDEMRRRGMLTASTALPAQPPIFDPFAPTFEVIPGAGGYTATIAMREGSVVYLVNATGPRSNAIKVSAAGLLPVLVEPLVEIPQ